MISALLRAYPTGRWRSDGFIGSVTGYVAGRNVRVTRIATGYRADHLWGLDTAEGATPDAAVSALLRGRVPA